MLSMFCSFTTLSIVFVCTSIWVSKFKKSLFFNERNLLNLEFLSICVNDQSFENGALAVLPESHMFDLDHNPSKVPGFSSGVVLTNDQKDKSDYYSLKAGDLFLHHCNIVHFAPPNLSEIPHINIAMRFRSLDDTIDAKRFEKYKKFLDSSVRIT